MRRGRAGHDEATSDGTTAPVLTLRRYGPVQPAPFHPPEFHPPTAPPDFPPLASPTAVWGAVGTPMPPTVHRYAQQENHYEEHKRRRRRKNRRNALIATAAFAAFVLLCVQATVWFADETNATVADGDILVTPHIDSQAPPAPPPTDMSATPIGVPAAPAVPNGNFNFSASQTDGSGPVAWDPCRPVHYVVNNRHTPANGTKYLLEAIDAASKATGLKFVSDGETDEAPSLNRPSRQDGLYGERWAPVLIAWTNADEVPELDGPVLGIGGPNGQSVSGGLAVYVSGTLVLDSDDFRLIAANVPNGAAVERSIIEHELAHVLGLAHVNDPTQLMNPETDGKVTTYGTGDLDGLAALGRGRCFPNV